MTTTTDTDRQEMRRSEAKGEEMGEEKRQRGSVEIME
jgi:hypothetical protein